MINDFKVEVDKIQIPRHREEILESFSNLNLKENELRNYTKFLNLQIIKTEYNKVLLKCLDKIKQNMDKLGAEVKARLAECEDIKFRNINDIKLYLKEYGFKKNKDDIENYLSKKYVPKEKNEEEIDDEKNSDEENKNIKDDKENKDNKENNENNNQTVDESKKEEKRKSILSRNKMGFSSGNNLNIKFPSNQSMNKKIEKFKFTLDKPKSKFKLKELINNFSVTNIPKKRELLIPLKIKKKNNFKKSETINELSGIEKPKNLKKFLFNTKQELSEADFQDFPFSLKKKEKEVKSPAKKNESEENDVNDNKVKNTVNLQNIDFSSFIGTEKKISFLSPSRGRANLYRKSIFKKTKAIFDNL